MRTTSVRLAALALSGGLALSACGGGGDSQEDGLANDEIVTTTPKATKNVDSVVWGLPTGEPTSVDPIRGGGNSEATVAANMCESLLSVQPDFSVAPGLAKSAEYVDDTTFVIDLRDDVTFWNGDALDADDVVFSLKRAADPAGGSILAGLFRRVTSIEKTGEHQVTLKLSEPDAQLRNALAGPGGAVLHQETAERASQEFGTPGGEVMCTGPYEFVEWTTGDSIELTAYDGYWNGDPMVQDITFRFLGDAATLTTALRSGEIDGAYDIPISTAVALQRADTGTVYRGASTQSLSFGPTTLQGPAADPRVREALDLAIDKQGVIESVLRGLGTAQKTFVAPLAWTGDPAADIYQEAYDALPAHEQDVERATQLVEEAGVTGETLTMAIPAGATTETQAATVVQSAAKEIGLDLQLETLQPTEFSELFYNPERRADFDFVCTVGYQEVPGALYYAPEFATPTGLFNWSQYENPEVTKLLGEAYATTDPVESAEKYVQAQEIFAPDNLQVTLAGLDSLLYLRDGLTGAPASIAHTSSPWALSLGGSD